jgi:hypothetical protein
LNSLSAVKISQHRNFLPLSAFTEQGSISVLKRWILALLPIPVLLLAANGQSWKDRKPAEWTPDDAKQVLTDSPWVKYVTPEVDRNANSGQRRQGGGANRGGGMGRGGVGISLPGVGIGRRTGGGYPGGGYPGGNYPNGDPNGGGRNGRRGESNSGGGQAQPRELTVRWESAFPVREAALKAPEPNAPSVDEAHYAVAVYGVPARMQQGDAKKFQDTLKKNAALKRLGRKDLKPSSVEVLDHKNSLVILYLFPRSKEITLQDKEVDFRARIGRFKITEPFYTDQMVYAGKLEL